MNEKMKEAKQRKNKQELTKERETGTRNIKKERKIDRWKMIDREIHRQIHR